MSWGTKVIGFGLEKFFCVQLCDIWLFLSICMNENRFPRRGFFDGFLELLESLGLVGTYVFWQEMRVHQPAVPMTYDEVICMIRLARLLNQMAIIQCHRCYSSSIRHECLANIYTTCQQ